MTKKLHKEYCEIEGCPIKDSRLLNHHHIIERTELNTSNNIWNLAVLCQHHHTLLHEKDIEILGVFPASNKQGRILIYKINGVPNVPGITEFYFKYQPQQMKIP